MRLRPVRCVVVFLLAAFASVHADAAAKRLLAYYPSWAKYQTPPYTASTIPYSETTHIVHAFLLVNPDGDGSLRIPSDLLEPELISKAHAAGVKVMISVGGASAPQSKGFRAIASDPGHRATFASNLNTFIVKNGYDGVDIDWEVPQGPADKKNCVLLMQAIRGQLPEPWLISMAVSSDPRSYGTGFDIPALTPILDFFNVMTYDFHGPWTNHAGHNSPLILSPADPGQEGSLKTSIDLYSGQYQVPSEKLNIGTAFYGYEFDTANALWARCTNCNTTTISVNYGTYIKQRINQQGWVANYDPVGRAPYLLRSSPEGFLTYDDAASTTRKVKYVLGKRQLGGVFMWDVSADYDGTTQDLLTAMFQAFSLYNQPNNF